MTRVKPMSDGPTRDDRKGVVVRLDRLVRKENYDPAPDALQTLGANTGELLGLEYEDLRAACPLFRLYVAFSPDVGTGVLPWWYFSRDIDWCWEASAVHDFWFAHEWLAEALHTSAFEVVNDRWYMTAERLARKHNKMRQYRAMRWVIRNLSHRWWMS